MGHKVVPAKDEANQTTTDLLHCVDVDCSYNSSSVYMHRATETTG
jgi:hypothetical protein